MEKSKRKKVGDGEFHLPEHIIQSIQSFMSGKEAAQTSILAKPWYSAWSTRPNLDFDFVAFCRHRQDHRNLEKTIQRYEELNLKIQSFRLRTICFTQDEISFACEVLAKAMRMGAVDLDVSLDQTQRNRLVLPPEVLESETLIRLFAANCRIDLGPELKVRASLKSLILRSVNTGGDIIWVIISNCPSIENLELSQCKCVCDPFGLKTKMFVLKPGRAFDKPNNPYRFHKLKSLLLDKVDIGTWIFDDFSSRFPCLKDLSLHHCCGYKEIQICSRTLERISITLGRTLRATFDVPNVRKFKFSGSCIPTLSFQSTAANSRPWESDVSIASTRNSHCLSPLYFSKLNELLMDLSPSVISLSLALTISSEESSGNYVIKSKRRPVVEKLTLSMCAPSRVCSDLLDGLFSSCRPKWINLLWIPIGGSENNDFVRILCKKLVKEVSRDCFVPNNSTCELLKDLEEVTVESCEEEHDEWRPLSWKTLLDASHFSEYVRINVRFQLRWLQIEDALK